MNLTELRDLLDDQARAASTQAAPTDARLTGALGKARTIRRRRLASAAIAVMTVAAIVSAVVVPRVINADDPAPAERPDMTLDEYAHGGKLISDAELDLPAATTTITFTPEAFPLTFEARCDRPLDVELQWMVEGIVRSGACGTEMQWLGEWEEGAPGDEPSIELGKPITFRLVVEGAYVADTDSDRNTGVPEGGRVVLGVYESVPRAQYQFPSPPEELIDLGSPGSAQDAPGRHVVESRNDPNGKVTMEFEGDLLEFEIRSQTPGVLRVRLNGKELGVAEFWDYSGKKTVPLSTSMVTNDRRGFQPLPEGRNVIEFIPEDFTGEWRALLTACDIHDGGGGMGCPASPEELAATPFRDVVQ